MLNYSIIKQIAKEQGFTLKDIADRLGFEYSGFYRAYTTGTLKYEKRVTLAKLLNISVEELQKSEEKDTKDISEKSTIQEPASSYLTMIDFLKEQIKTKDEQIKTLQELLKRCK